MKVAHEGSLQARRQPQAEPQAPGREEAHSWLLSWAVKELSLWDFWGLGLEEAPE